MDKKDFIQAMSMIDDDLMSDADMVTKSGVTDYEESVSGVETYRRPVWQTVAMLVASLMLVVSVGAGGTYFFTHRGVNAPEEEQIIVASTTETETTSAETDEQAEVTTMRTRKRDTLAKTTLKDTETKESTNTEPVTASPENGEVEGVSGSGADERAPISTAPVTKASAPAATTVQTTTIPVWTQSPQTTTVQQDPNWYYGIEPPEDYDIFAQLASNSYSPYPCDGIPEYRLVAPDGTEYLINLTDKWVWRRTPDMIGQPGVEPEETYLTFSEWYYLEIRGADIGMRECLWD
ncbi:MAG: hypothetical protein J6Y71_05185 [Ruminococcus sp.]|nr:hypothetical protein [Ruminococcus sp.]